ncbi:putative ATP-binding protein involved in virulence [Cyclonatronum proteinivorum]|uniref:Putative ATP-binding protein involved in virulence n=1 Tax=Cyclonatronum proteinivorum TaxID=1457365 RepID=A0A345UHS5_9BACT|nr:AAA family ATPase [Cyclonatronum proteinivorum]AXJ00027.1 putative ATP-binding protein involved in virulence [Cyclonatronum proteinivorum]
MRIDKVKIVNFKGFTDETFELNPRFTVFIGDNAKGKTTVLDALAICAGSFLRGIDVAKHEARGINKREVRVKTIEGQPRPQLPAEIECIGEVNGIYLEEGWKRTVDKLSQKTTTTYVNAKNIESLATEMLQESRKNGGVTFPVIAYHGTGRLWAEHEEKKAVYKKQGEGVALAYTRCLSPKSSSKEFLSWYKTYEDEIRKFGSPKEKSLLESFKKAIISMIPDDHWTDMSYSFKDEDLVGIFRKGDHPERLLFSQLSDGYRNLIGMVADIAYRCIKLNPHLGDDAVSHTPGLVLIDELDLHLHPNWQKRIVSDLKKVFKNIQFVATTHSPFIVQSLKADELINLDEVKGLDHDPDKYSVEEISENEMGVLNVKRSIHFSEMQMRAKEYFDLVKDKASPDEIAKAKRLLDSLRVKYSKDPAYVALLESELPKQ